MKRLASRTLLFLVILTLAIPALPLLAQEQQQPKSPSEQQKTAEEEKKPKVTEEMVVTARKREETVQEVPMSVAAPTESELRDRGAETIEDVAANVAGFSVQNLGPGQSQQANSGERAGGRVSFLFKPNAKLSITPRLLYQDVEMNGWNRIDAYNILANPFTTTRPQVSLGDHKLFTQIAEPFSDKFGLADVNLSYDLGGGKTFTAISSYIDRKVDVLRDATALTPSITGGSIGLPPSAYNIDAPLDDHTKAHGFTQEARLSGIMPKLQWVAGGFYANNHRDYGQDLNVNGFEAATGIHTTGIAAPKDELFFSDLHYKLRQTALFGE